MKNLLILFVLALVLPTMLSCKKEQDRVVYGQIIDATGAPVASTKFQLYGIYDSRRFLNGKTTFDLFPFSTDNAGNFRVLFVEKKKATGIEIQDEKGYVSIDGGGLPLYSVTQIPKKGDIDAGVIKLGK